MMSHANATVCVYACVALFLLFSVCSIDSTCSFLRVHLRGCVMVAICIAAASVGHRGTIGMSFLMFDHDDILGLFNFQSHCALCEFWVF